VPEYNLYCDDCNQNISIFCGISEYDTRIKNTICPNCTSKNVYRNYKEDNIYSTIKEIRTIGQLADSNEKKNKSILNELEAKKKESKKEEKPWYHKNSTATNKEINKMDKKQKAKYIMESKK